MRKIIGSLLLVNALSVVLIACAWSLSQIKKVSPSFWLICSVIILGLLSFTTVKVDTPDTRRNGKSKPGLSLFSWFPRYLVTAIVVMMIAVTLSEWGLVIALQAESVKQYNIAHNRMLDFSLLAVVILSIVLQVTIVATTLARIKTANDC